MFSNHNKVCDKKLKNYFHKNKRYIINIEPHVHYFLFLFIALVYFAQEYIPLGLVVYVFLRKIKSCNKYRISNELSFITKFITWVGKHDIIRGSAEHNIIFANECNKFSNKWQRIWDFIYYITVKTIGISILQL